jgi:MFS transporter, UMF1 family
LAALPENPENTEGPGSYEAVKTAPRGEILSWAMYDFANSAYTTIVSTTIFNPFFVQVVAGEGSGLKPGQGTFLLTASICVSSLAVVLSAPIIGTIADALAGKKKILLFATLLCVGCTTLLCHVGRPGAYIEALILLTLANFAYYTAEDLVAAFLPELAAREDMGKVSAFGWTIGYLGGLSALAICFAYVVLARHLGQTARTYVPVTMLITAAFYGLAALPIFLFLKERARPDPLMRGRQMLSVGFARLRKTLAQAARHQDLFRFLISLLVYSCGTATVISLASVYAEQVMGFTTNDSLVMIFAVNVTAAIGAFSIGHVQDRIGSIPTLGISLCLWIIATGGAFFCTSRVVFWILANLIGLAMGSSGSSGRALVGLFSPPGRSGEFFGLWGLSGKLATAVGPLTFGLVTLFTHNNYRLALLSSTSFFVIGLLLLLLVNEKRGKEAALLQGGADHA